jgi:chorismate mutase
MTDELKKLRDAIDKIDNELLELISIDLSEKRKSYVVWLNKIKDHFQMKVLKVSIRALCLIVEP